MIFKLQAWYGPVYFTMQSSFSPLALSIYMLKVKNDHVFIPCYYTLNKTLSWFEKSEKVIHLIYWKHPDSDSLQVLRTLGSLGHLSKCVGKDTFIEILTLSLFSIYILKKIIQNKISVVKLNGFCFLY